MAAVPTLDGSAAAACELKPAQNREQTSYAGNALRSSTDERLRPPLRNRNRERAARRDSRLAASGCDTPQRAHASAACRESAGHSQTGKWSCDSSSESADGRRSRAGQTPDPPAPDRPVCPRREAPVRDSPGPPGRPGYAIRTPGTLDPAKRPPG